MENRQNILIGFLIFLIALFYNAFLLGWDSLNPQSLWLVSGGDPSWHYLGGAFFLNEPWHWPPGVIETQNITARTSVGLTDSIPLAAFVLKLFAGIGEGGGQYFGCWHLLSLFLMGVFGILWARQWTQSLALQLLVAAFLIASPLILMRLTGHAALTAQWLVVGAMWFYQKPWRLLHWAALVAIAALIHPYLLAMVLGIALCKAIYVKKIIPALPLILLAACLTYLAGYFEGTSIAAEGFGYNRARLFSFFVPWLHENSLFAGLGVFALAGVLLVSRFFYKNKIQFFSKKTRGLGMCVFVMVAFSIFTYHAAAIWPIGVLGKMFRANVRFGWPLVYLFTLFVLAGVIQTFPKKIAIVLLSVALFWQISPFHPFADIYGQFRTLTQSRKKTPMPTFAELNIFTQNADTLMIVTRQQSYGESVPFARYAANHRLKTNFVWDARTDEISAQQFQKELWQALQNGQRAPQTFYVFLSDYSADFLKENLPLELANALIFFENYAVLPAKNDFPR